jgi:hypothetical protein
MGRSGQMGPTARGDAGTMRGQAQTWNGGRWDGRHHRGHFRGPVFGFGFGGGDYYDPYAYAYAPQCEIVRIRHVRPNGRVIYRNAERCY